MKCIFSIAATGTERVQYNLEVIFKLMSIKVTQAHVEKFLYI